MSDDDTLFGEPVVPVKQAVPPLPKAPARSSVRFGGHTLEPPPSFELIQRHVKTAVDEAFSRLPDITQQTMDSVNRHSKEQEETISDLKQRIVQLEAAQKKLFDMIESMRIAAAAAAAPKPSQAAYTAELPRKTARKADPQERVV